MAQIETWFSQDLQQAVKVHYIDGNVFSADNNGNIIGVNVFDDGEPATLGGTVSASIIRADGATVAATGTLSGNQVSVALPQSAYAVPGVISVVLKLTSGTTVTTLLAVVGNVYQSTTDTVVDPGTIIPSIDTLIAAIEAAVASIPADYSALWTSLAPAFSSSTAYKIGQYVTYNGGLYRFTSAHPAGSWASGDATAVTLGGDAYWIKSGLSEDEAFARFNKNYTSGVNCFDLVRWLIEIGATHSVSGGVCSFYVNVLLDTPYVFSDEDVPVTFDCSMTIVDGSGQKFTFWDSTNTQVGQWKPGDPPWKGVASKVRMTYGTRGNVQVSNLSLVNRSFSNEDLKKSANANGSALAVATDKENIMNFDAYLDASGMTYTKSGNTYTVSVNTNGVKEYRFAPSDIPVIMSADIAYGTGSGIVILLINSDGQVVNQLTKNTKYIKGVASSYYVYYGTAGTATITNPKIVIDNSIGDTYAEGIKKATGNLIPVAPPSGFSWSDAPVVGHIFTDGKGGFVVKDFDVSEYKNDSANGVDYYVNPVIGSDTAYNGLTPFEPFKSCAKAYSMSNVRTIYMMPGVYGRTESPYGIGQIGKDVNIIGFGGDVISTNDWALGWVAEGHENVVKKSTSLVPERIVDVLRKGADGNYINFTQVETVSDVYATADSFASVDGVLYAHVSGDNYQEWNNIVCCRQNDSNIGIYGECTVYLEGIIAIGGSTPIRVQATDSTHSPTLYAKNCEFWYGQGDASYRNAVTIRGARLCIFQGCKALWNGGTDGFNYHAYQDIIPKAIELNCQGLHNGGTNDGNDQGSTAHEGVKVIRIGGVYAFNRGANLGDEGMEEATTYETESWNLGCVCFNSESGVSAQHGNFMAYFGAKMWMDGCVAYGSRGNLAGNLSNMKLRLPQFYGELKSPEATGDPTTY